jgi:two-component system NtrC family sensor kinase
VQRRVEALQRQRDDLVEELARVSRAAALGEIASGIAHDLTNPLAVINEEVGWLGDLLSTATVAPEPTRQEFANSLAQIARQIKRAADFTRRVLDWARDLDGAGTTVGVNGVLIATLYLLEGELAAGNVRVTNALDPELPPVAGNEQDLGQVFLHLMKNALDAMKGGGGTLGISTGHANGMVWVAIADTGTGIPPDLVGRIFEPFFTTKPEGSGTGLGLRISSWIVQRAGGRIEVESAPGKGATFRVVLPAAAPPEQRPGSGESHADHSAAARR